jgi:2'-5' RNA ligase
VRLFVAVWPPDDVIEQLRTLPRTETPGVRWSGEEQWHVTLRFLGDVDDVDEVVDALSGVNEPAMQVEVGPATTRLGHAVLMLPVRGLDSLSRALPLDLDKPFRGHLTVARAKNKQDVPRSMEGSPFAASWTATSFELVRSQTRPSGAVYTNVETFPLQ